MIPFTPDKLYYFLNFIPHSFLTLMILILSLKSNVSTRRNYFILIASGLSLLDFLIKVCFIFTNDVTVNRLAYIIQIYNFITCPMIVLFSYGLLDILLEKNTSASAKLPVWALVVLTIFSFGFYVPYWYLKHRQVYGVKQGLIIVLAVIITYYFYARLQPSILNDFGGKTTLTLLNAFVIIYSIYLVFELRKLIALARPETEIDGVPTFFLGIFYLQYKINESESSMNNLSPLGREV